MELERTQSEWTKRGLKVAAVTHDSVPLISQFVEQKNLTLPVLSNREGLISMAFGIENQNVPKDDIDYGRPFPGTYIIDGDGIVEAKFFEDDRRERYTATTILVKHFKASAGQAISTTETRHLKLTTSASEAVVRAGNLVTLSVKVELGENMHVYAPGVENGYIPIRWDEKNTPGWVAMKPAYPESKTIHMEAIDETVPVYEGTFIVQRDILIGQDPQVDPLLTDGKIVVEGALRYQACDEKMCYRPETVPLQWELDFGRHDWERSPEELRDVDKPTV